MFVQLVELILLYSVAYCYVTTFWRRGRDLLMVATYMGQPGSFVAAEETWTQYSEKVDCFSKRMESPVRLREIKATLLAITD